MQHKQIQVFINGSPKEVEKRNYSFGEVVELAFGSYDTNKAHTMVSTDKHGKNPHTYSVGDKINMKEGMRINVDSTIRS